MIQLDCQTFERIRCVLTVNSALRQSGHLDFWYPLHHSVCTSLVREENMPRLIYICPASVVTLNIFSPEINDYLTQIDVRRERIAERGREGREAKDKTMWEK